MANNDNNSTSGDQNCQEIPPEESNEISGEINEENGVLVDATNQQVAQSPQQAAPQEQGVDKWTMFKGFAFRLLVIYFISSLFRRGQQPAPGTGPNSAQPTALPSSNIFPKDTLMDLYVYISEKENHDSFSKNDLFWKLKKLQYGDWYSGPNGDSSYEKVANISISQNVQRNGSLWIHIYFVRYSYSPNPSDKRYRREFTVYKKKQLNKFKKRYFVSTVNLLTGETEAHPDLIKKGNRSDFEILSHWHPNLTVNLVDDHTPWTRGSLPQPLDQFVDFVPNSPQHYYPILYFNEFWNLNSDYQPINETLNEVEFRLIFFPLSLFRWQMYAAQGMRNQWLKMFADDNDDDDQDSMKRTLTDTNPYLLAVTIAVSIVHTVFEFLAFKNDIQFWRNRKSLEGLSVRSIFFNVFQSLIVLLYVMDNETNTLVKFSILIGLGIELWKIHKVVDIKIDREHPWFGNIPRIRMEDKSTYTESKTKQFDQLAFKYLGILLFPLLGGYAVYSLLYLEHKGWYSWVLSMLYGFLLTFGFIMMTPQLFINYKLKSVAHLPWRMMTYKALNTFIDDMFAFVIKMPTLYRIGCFRDDIVFFIFLYQRYIYRIDPKRVNEFGTSQEMFDENGQLIPLEENEIQEEADGNQNEAGSEAETNDRSEEKPDTEEDDDSQEEKSHLDKKTD